MKVTRLGPARPYLASASLGGSGGGITGAVGSGLVPISSGSNSWSWGSNVATITSNGSNTLLGPHISLLSGAGVAFAAASNSLTISSSGVGGSGGIVGGTAFPGSPSNNDLFYRTDLDIIFFYNGTRWLCTCPHVIQFEQEQALVPITASTARRSALPSLTLDFWAMDFWMASFVETTNSATQYWTVTLNATSTVLSTISNAPNVGTIESAAVNAVLGPANFWLTLTITKVSTPGAAYLPAHLSYRYIGT